MRNLFPILLCSALLTQPAGAQNLHFPDGSGKIEIALLGGGVSYQGDLVPKEDAYQPSTLEDLKTFVGVIARYRITPGLSARLSVSVGKIDGDDSRFPQPAWRQRRAFSFTSPLQEFAIAAEYDFLGELRARRKFPLGVYVFAGLGAARTNPDRDFSRTDVSYFGPNDPAVAGVAADQADSGPRTSFVIPAGFGIRVDPSRYFGIFGEAGFRKCFSDRLDGFDHSVSSADSDTYTMYSLGLILKLPFPKRPNPYAI